MTTPNEAYTVHIKSIINWVDGDLVPTWKCERVHLLAQRSPAVCEILEISSKDRQLVCKTIENILSFSYQVEDSLDPCGSAFRKAKRDAEEAADKARLARIRVCYDCCDEFDQGEECSTCEMCKECCLHKVCIDCHRPFTLDGTDHRTVARENGCRANYSDMAASRCLGCLEKKVYYHEAPFEGMEDPPRRVFRDGHCVRCDVSLAPERLGNVHFQENPEWAPFCVPCVKHYKTYYKQRTAEIDRGE